ncbi:MAG: nickel pincer cofactor biosynthesis protein LarB [Sphingomonadaceae bacterium]|nr:nickel pincer cofactor biosynthesis protein LarB [Sphingomonadaceae bacterium]
MSFVYDEDRRVRLGMPEAVFCEGKDIAALNLIIAELGEAAAHPVLFTRLAPERHALLDPLLAARLNYDPASRTGVLHGTMPAQPGTVAVVTAGTSDLVVAREAVQTLAFAGHGSALVADVGVAGVHRLFERLDLIRSHDVVIVFAGWDAALASVVGGLVAQPVIAVPTSVGYGVATGGRTALHSMLASCGQGVTVTNIDNGFGAACGAIRILNGINRRP